MFLLVTIQKYSRLTITNRKALAGQQNHHQSHQRLVILLTFIV